MSKVSVAKYLDMKNVAIAEPGTELNLGLSIFVRDFRSCELIPYTK